MKRTKASRAKQSAAMKKSWAARRAKTNGGARVQRIATPGGVLIRWDTDELAAVVRAQVSKAIRAEIDRQLKGLVR